MKSRLHGNHDNHSTTKWFFAIFSKNVVKNDPISNASWVHNFQLQNSKVLWSNRSVFVNFENIIFMGRACQILGRDRWKNRDKTGKMPNFPGLWKGIFTICPWMVRTSPILPFWPQISTLTPELSQKSPKNYVFEQIFKHFLNLNLSLPLFLG